MIFKGQEVVSEDYWVEKASADIDDDDVRYQYVDMFKRDVEQLRRRYATRYSNYLDQVIGQYADGITAEKMAEMFDDEMELFEDLINYSYKELQDDA